MNDLERTTYQLRPHQADAIKAVRKSFLEGKKRPVLQAPCSFGKTLISIDIIKSALKKLHKKGSDKKVCFVVDRVTLIEQTSREFDRHGLTEHGIIQADHPRTDYAQQLQIASIQTLAKWNYKPDFALIIQDENHATHTSFLKYLKTIPETPVLGLSGTPWARNMSKHWDDLITTKTAKDLMNEGFISEYTIYGGEVPDTKNVDDSRGDYNQKQLAEVSIKGRIIADIVKNWFRYGENRQTILFCVNIAHSKKVCAEFEAAGVRTGHIDCHTKHDERKRLLKEHDLGYIKILSNCTVFSKGHDSPSTTCLILARKTKSLMLYVQMLFRVLRISPDKKEAIILDHSGSCSLLGRPEDIIINKLDDGKPKNKTEKRKEEIEREIKADKPCSVCGTLHSKFKCPKCGKEPKINPHVMEIKAELKEILAKEKPKQSPAEQRHKTHTKQQKELMWGAFSRIANNKGYAGNLYREYYGVWAKGLSPENTTKEALITAKKFKQAKQIAYTNRKK